MKNKPNLNLLSPVTSLPTPADFDRAARQLGFALPPSYVRFAQTYGRGLLCGLFNLYLPLENPACDDLPNFSAERAGWLKEALQEKWVNFNPDGSPELAARLVAFGASENGDMLAWDPQDSTGAGEFRIYVLGSRYAFIRKAAGDLDSFIEKILEPGVGGVLGRAEFNLEAKFEPR